MVVVGIDPSVAVVVVVVGVVDVVAVVDIASGTVDNLQDVKTKLKSNHLNEQLRKILVDKVLLIKSIKNLPSTF